MTKLFQTTISTIVRKNYFGRTGYLALMTLMVLFTLVAIFVLPVRNVIFYSVIELAWRDVATSDLIRIHYGPQRIPDGILSTVSCLVVQKPNANRQGIKTSNILIYDHLTNPEIKKRVLEEDHGRFLPALSMTERVDILYMYLVASSALSSAGVKHFLVAGSLLGLHRHGGFVPWDDDLDIAVSLDSRSVVQQALSCIDGFTLNKLDPGHWKFQYSISQFPFLDIFFYKMDESHVWAVTRYIRKTFIYPKRFVFPLAESTFEGVKVPVPNDGLSIVRRIYQYDQCVAHQGHKQQYVNSSKEYSEGYSVTNLPCKDLFYMYRFFLPAGGV